MNIAEHSVVNFHYTLSDDQGIELESSHGGQASTYLHGANNIIKGLEQAMAGKSAGDSFEVSLEPEQAYGLPKPDSSQKVPVKHLIYKGKLKNGMNVQLNTQHGARSVTVTKVGRHSATVDTNHPLAGKALTFSIEILDVRAASSEELDHGHVHGPGGHQH